MIHRIATHHRVLAALVALAVAALGATPSPSAAYPGAPWFEPGTVYDENFPDPSVFYEGGTYYAYAGNTGGVYLPAMTSTDLTTWRARSAYQPVPYPDPVVDPFFNDALVAAPSWATTVDPSHNHLRKEVRAPGVARIGGGYVAFTTVRVAPGSPGRFCISVATASSPLGPFVDNSAGPLVCDPDPVGSIDPEPFVDADGTPYLLWKSEGVPGSTPTRIWVRQLTATGTSFAPGSGAVELLATAQPWEGNVIENPSMIRYQDRYYLFYSGNEWQSGAYATGYAACAGPLGPCARELSGPLLASSGDQLGPGGADAFVDADGRLRLAYHAWNAPYTSYPAYPQCEGAGTCETQGQRRMHVVEVSVGSDGALQLGSASAGLAAFEAQTPTRLFDTRYGPGPLGKLAPGQTLDVQVVGEAGVPSSGVSAVVLNLTATEASGDGFVTAFPSGQVPPLASNLNLVAGQTAPNLVVVPIGSGGRVSFYSQSGTHLLADVLGWFELAETARAGRFVPLDPERLVDSRDVGGPVGPGETLRVQVGGEAGVPSSGVSAVVVNLTATEALAEGFVTAWPAGQDRPLASSLNLAGPGDETANLVVVPLGVDGAINLFTQRGTHLLADVAGYFTDETASSSGSGLFVAVPPRRVGDTRSGPGPLGYVARRGSITLSVAGAGGIPDDGSAAAAVVNLTATEAGGAGYVTAWPAGTALPLASNVNLRHPHETRPNAAFVKLGGGAIGLYSHSGAHLVVDAAGYFTS